MINAEHANVSKLLHQELESLGNEGIRAESLQLNLQPVENAARAEGKGEDASLKTVIANEEPFGKPGTESTRVIPAILAPHVKKIEYLTWRHLEHILSVCAIPIASLPNSVRAQKQNEEFKDEGVGMVALTCGDMSGHRVCTSASFYAFKFLVDIERRLASSGIQNCYTVSLRQRILSTCEGHIKWLAHVWRKRDQKRVAAGSFAANYWVTGKEMSRESITWQLDDTTTDTAL